MEGEHDRDSTNLLSFDVGEGGADPSSSWKKLRSERGAFALSRGEGERAEGWSDVLEGARCADADEGKLRR